MNRRQFFAATASSAIGIPALLASATDVAVLESPIMNVLSMLPDTTGPNGFDFPITTALNHRIQREVWPENPEMYWDPIGEDYRTVFGFHTSVVDLSVSQSQLEHWRLDSEQFNPEDTMANLSALGWEMVDEVLRIMRYTGDASARETFASSLNLMGEPIRSRDWDLIGFPDDSSMVLGADEELVRTVADRIQTHTAMLTVDVNFHGLNYVLPVDAYHMMLVPPQALHVPGAESTFVSKSWTGDAPIVQSVGLRMQNAEAVEPMVESIQSLLESEVSTLRNLPYADFLSFDGHDQEYSSVRLDFTVTDGEWDILQAFAADDLRMLPR